MSMPNFDVKGVRYEEAFANLLQSIALEEAGLAHILNAEGQKLEKCIEKICDCEDMLKVNDSVVEVLKNVVKAQILLQFKLEEVKTIKCKKDNDCHKKDKRDD